MWGRDQQHVLSDWPLVKMLHGRFYIEICLMYACSLCEERQVLQRDQVPAFLLSHPLQVMLKRSGQLTLECANGFAYMSEGFLPSTVSRWCLLLLLLFFEACLFP